MNSKITFLNDHLFWSIVAGAIILLGFFIWKELATPGRRRLILKILLSILAVVALALIALKPALHSPGTAGKIILLTPGYEKQHLDSLRKDQPRIKVLDYSSQQPEFNELQEAEVVYILGHGFKEYDLGKLENINTIYLPGKSPPGILKVRFPEKNAVGDGLNIRGIYHKPRPGHQLVLQGPGRARLDSVDLSNDQEQGFKLTTELKAAGNFVYYLAEKDADGEILTQDPVPVLVEEKQNLKILILNNFPTFETKYLKNYLAEAGHEVVVRSQITRGRFKYEYFNTNRKVIGSITRETLEAYDLLIIDAGSLRSLAGSQSLGIQNAVSDDGLGVFIQPDETFFSSPGAMVNLKFDRQGNNKVRLEGQAAIDVSVFQFTFNRSPGQESIYSAGNSIIAGYKRNGQGRIGTSVLSNTWQLILEGNSEAYKQIWSRVIEQLSKRENAISQIEQRAQFVFPHESFHFIIRSELPDPGVTNHQGSTIPLEQDVNFPQQWEGTVWPREPGWNRLQQDTSSVFDYYVAEEGAWGPLTAQKTLEVNTRFFDRAKESGQGQMPPEPINPFWFYVLFLICMGGLWLEPKLS